MEYVGYIPSPTTRHFHKTPFGYRACRYPSLLTLAHYVHRTMEGTRQTSDNTSIGCGYGNGIHNQERFRDGFSFIITSNATTAKSSVKEGIVTEIY